MPLKRYLPFLIAVAAVLAACAPKVSVPTLPASTAPAPAVPSADQLLGEAEQRYSQKDYAGAAAAYEAFIAAHPSHDMAPVVRMKLGAAYQALGDHARARQAYEGVISGHAGVDLLQEAWVAVLASDYDQGRFEAVITHLDSALTVITKDALRLRANLLAGDAYMALEAPTEAVLAYVRAYRTADGGVRDGLRERIASALRLMDRDVFDNLLARIADPEMARTVADLGRTIIYRQTTIGCLLPLSGAYQVFGQRALTGIEMAMAEVSRDHPTVALVVRDSAGDPGRAAAAVTELAEAGVAAIVGPIASADAAARAAQSLGIPMIALTQREGITGLGDYIFRNFITPRVQAEALVTHAVTQRGVRRFAILYPEDNYGKTFMNLFWDEIIRQGATVAAVTPYDGDQNDFSETVKRTLGLSPAAGADAGQRPELTQMGDRFPFADSGGELIGLYHRLPPDFYAPQPDPAGALAPSLLWQTADRRTAPESRAIVDFEAVFIPDAPRTAGLIIPQLAYYDVLDRILLGTNLWHSDELIKMSRDAVQGAIFPDGFFPDSQRPVVQRFVAAYLGIYGEAPGFIEAIGYDSAKLLLEIVTRPSVRSRADIRDALVRTADYPGVTGITAFDFNGEVRKQPFLITFHGSRLEEITPPPTDAHPLYGPPPPAGTIPEIPTQ